LLNATADLLRCQNPTERAKSLDLIAQESEGVAVVTAAGDASGGSAGGAASKSSESGGSAEKVTAAGGSASGGAAGGAATAAIVTKAVGAPVYVAGGEQEFAGRSVTDAQLAEHQMKR